MPTFNPASTKVTTSDDIEIGFYGYKKTTRTTSLPDNGGSSPEAQSAVYSLAQLSNMGLEYYTYSGQKFFIAKGQVSVFDEAHDDTYTLRMVFQDNNTASAPEVVVNIPAPRRILFDSGVLLNRDNALAQAAINDTLTFINGGAVAVFSYTLVSAVLNTASDREKRPLPIISDPT